MLSRRKFIKQSGLGFGFALMPTSFNFFDLMISFLKGQNFPKENLFLNR